LNEKRARSVQTLCILLIFALFAGLSLCLVLTGADVFRGVSERVEENDRIRTSLAYAANKVRAGDESGAVAAGSDGKSLVIASRAGGKTYKTYLYWHGGYLMESFLAADQPLAPGDGEKIARLADFSVRRTGRLLTFTAVSPGGRRASLSVCPRSS
jgi:hypothetical protein